MEDGNNDHFNLSRVQFRIRTFENIVTRSIRSQLAKAGFYYSSDDQKVKCFICATEIDSSEINCTVDFGDFHREKNPECHFARNPEQSCSAKLKKFDTHDSLRFEKERLATFIEFPVPFVSPKDLAADGFYYLRIRDYCHCFFCQKTVGEWKAGDTPRAKHIKHSPTCPFIKGLPVGNITREHSAVLDTHYPSREEYSVPPPENLHAPGQSSSYSNGTGVRGMPTSYSVLSNASAPDLERQMRRYICKICNEAETKVVFLPCSHMVACSNCAVKLTFCPRCHSNIKYVLKPIIP